jgi:hypothetical protein
MEVANFHREINLDITLYNLFNLFNHFRNKNPHFSSFHWPMKIFSAFRKTFVRKYSTQDIFVTFPKAKPHGETLKKAISFFESNNLKEATKLFEESSTNLSQELPKNHPLLGIAFNNYAECLRKHSPTEIQKIEQLYTTSLDIWTHEENETIFSSQLGTLFNNIGL